MVASATGKTPAESGSTALDRQDALLMETASIWARILSVLPRLPATPVAEARSFGETGGAHLDQSAIGNFLEGREHAAVAAFG